MNEESVKFKKLLEYFVAHLEWIVGNDANSRGYKAYIESLLADGKFKSAGQGYLGATIQDQIKDWEQYRHGKICINIQANFGDYTSVKSYLNWEGTGINIIARWNGDKTKICKLSQDCYLGEGNRKKIGTDKNLDELGLFDNLENITENLMAFWESFNRQIIEYQNMQRIKPYVKLLETNKNLILTGAPGTGKTYLAKQIAKQIGESEFVQFHPSYDYTDFVEGLRPLKKDGGEIGFELKDGIFKSFCKKALQNLIDSGKSEEELNAQQTASESLALFLAKIDSEIAEKGEYPLEGIGGRSCAPIVGVKQNGFIVKSKQGNETPLALGNFFPLYEKYKQHRNLDFSNHEEVKEKIGIQYNTYFFAFMKAFDEFINGNTIAIAPIEKVERKNYVFIIDEINRAEISKVFGELFFSIDPGYRGESGRVKTQYANLQDENDVFAGGFFIPENVYIIGTMNDIDRSVESMDFAMRRRFAWKEIKAGERISMWDGEIDDWAEEALERMNSLNKAIEEIQGLSSAYHIGPAYFLKLKEYAGDFESLWNNHLESVVFEYLRGLPNSEELMSKLKTAYDVKNNG